MSRVAIPVVIVPANDIDAGDELGDQGVAIDAGNDHILTNPTGKVALLAIFGVSTQAQGTLAVPTQPTATDTVTIGVGSGQKVYTWRATADYDADGEVEIKVAGVAASRQSFVDAINGDDAENSPHTQVTAALGAGNTIILTAIDAGVLGNQIVTTETFTAVGNVFDAGTLGTTTAGGVGPAATITVKGVTDPYGRIADIGPRVLTGEGVYLLGRFSPALFNQTGAEARKVHVDAASVTGSTAIKIVALSL